MRAVGFFTNNKLTTDSDTTKIDFKEFIKKYCHEHNHKLSKIFSPNPDISNEDDTQLNLRYKSLIKHFNDPEKQKSLILIPNSSHLANNLEIFIYRFIELYEMNLRILCINSDTIDPLQNAEKFLNLSGRESINLNIKRDKIFLKASKGKVLGKIPYGYNKSDFGDLIVDTKEAEIVIKILDLYTNLESRDKRFGLRKISKYLNDKGFRTRNNNLWNTVSLLSILRNTIYIGNYYRYGVQISNNHQSIVDITKFNLAQDILKQRTPKRNKTSVTNVFKLSKILRCNKCKKNLNGLTRNQSWINKTGEKKSKIYRYYICPSRRVRSDPSNLGHVIWSFDPLEKLVVKKIQNLSKSQKKKLKITLFNYEKKLRFLEVNFIKELRNLNHNLEGFISIKSVLNELMDLKNNKNKIKNEHYISKEKILDKIYSKNLLIAIENISYLDLKIYVHDEFLDIKI